MLTQRNIVVELLLVGRHRLIVWCVGPKLEQLEELFHFTKVFILRLS